MFSKRVAVLMGGKSAEREVSLRTGARVIGALEVREVSVVVIDPIDSDWLNQLLSAEIDIAFLALHGKGYEDGTIQGVLESFGIPYTGSGILASAIAMNKIVSKQIFETANIPTPKSFKFDSGQDVTTQCQIAADQLGLPVVVKPITEGSSIGVSMADNVSELQRMATQTAKEFGEIFFEQHISGMEISVGLLGTEKKLHALPVLELVPKRDFYDYEAKYTAGMTEFIIPARLLNPTTELVQEIALNTHRSIGCRGFSRVDMLVGEFGQPYVIEINTLPGLTELSDLPAQAKAAGISYDQLIDQILTDAEKIDH